MRVASAPKSAKLGGVGDTYGGEKNVQQVFTQYILIAMALGHRDGGADLQLSSRPKGADIASSVNLIAMAVPAALIKMIIAPLGVLQTLVGGIAHMGKRRQAGGGFSQRPWAGSSAPRSSSLLLRPRHGQPAAGRVRTFPGTLPDKAQSTGLPVSAFSIEKNS